MKVKFMDVLLFRFYFVLLLEGVSRLDADEKHVIREMIEGMLVKHQTKQMVKNLAG